MKKVRMFLLLVVFISNYSSVFALDTSMAAQAGAQWLIDRQGDHSGWESYSVVATNAMAVRAFVSAGRTNSQKYPVLLQRLKDLQSADGSWDESIWGTAHAIWALVETGHPVQSSEIQSALTWLKANRSINGSWGSYDGTALSIIALIKAGESKTSFLITEAVQYLKDTQLPDGYWGPGVSFHWYGYYIVPALCMADSHNSAEVNNAINWLSLKLNNNDYCDYIILYASALAQNSTVMNQARNKTLGLQNADGGWGKQSMTLNISNNEMTAYAFNSLVASNYSEQATIDATNWIENHINVVGDFYGAYQETYYSSYSVIALAGRETLSIVDTLNSFALNQHSSGGWHWYSHYGNKNHDNQCTSRVIISYNYSGLANSYQTQIDNGCSYLINGQNTDGGWGEYPKWYVVTDSLISRSSNALTALLLNGHNYTSPTIYNGIAWLMNERVGSSWGNCNSTASAIRILDMANVFSSEKETAIGWLISQQNVDGGWGSKLGNTSTVNSTSGVLIALDQVGGYKTSRIRGASWLVSAQNIDGGWANLAGTPASNTYSTACATWALSKDYSEPNAIGLSITTDQEEIQQGDTIVITVDTSEENCELYATLTDPESWYRPINFLVADPNTFTCELKTSDTYPLGTYSIAVEASKPNFSTGFENASFDIGYTFFLRGDINGDKKVDISDFVILSEDWLKELEG